MECTLLSTPGWEEYQLLDTGEGYRLEQFGPYRLVRPDPQIIWKRTLPEAEWQKANAVFLNDRWDLKTKMPHEWPMHYNGLTFMAKLSPFKHTGVFPEQKLQWDWMEERIRPGMKILNLFAYTGIATLVAAKAGASVTHVDASRPTIGWARENQELSGLAEKPIRWILDDVVKFVGREVKRGNTYDGIILDPPVYGHGPTGQVWKFNESVPELLSMCKQILSPDPSFVILNAYAISSSSLMLSNVFQDYFGSLGGTISVGELVLESGKKQERPLSTGIFARWSK